MHLLADLADVECCPDGEAALERLNGRSYDWILLDVGLPGLDGFELLPRIRELAPASRVVVCSGLPLGDGRKRALEGGAVDFLEKPLSPLLLSQLLGR